MLKIKLARVGKKNQPAYRLVVLEHKKDPHGDCLEILGHYNPKANPKIIELKTDRIKHWLSVGAQASPTVHNLLVDQKILEGDKVVASSGKKRKKKKVAEATDASKAPSASSAAADTADKEAPEGEAQAPATPPPAQDDAAQPPAKDEPVKEEPAEAKPDEKPKEESKAEEPKEEKKEEKPKESPNP